MKIKQVFWFSSSHSVIGIVLGEDEITGEKKGYIDGGDVNLGFGLNEEADIKHIVSCGAKIHSHEAQLIADHFKSLVPIDARCTCGHSKAAHIYHEGACRPGSECRCQKFEQQVFSKTSETISDC